MIGEFFFQDHPWIVLLVQGTACLAVGLLASYALGRRAARAHHVLWIATLAAVLMPTAYWLVDRFELGVLSPETAAVEPLDETLPPALNEVDLASVLATEIAVNPPIADPPVVDESEVIAEAAPVPVVAETPINIPWRGLLWACWLTVTTLLLGRLLLRFVLGMRLVRRSLPAQNARLHEALSKARKKSEIDATVALRKNHHVRSPIIWCWSKPPVLLVHHTTEQVDETIDWTGVFCHELAHWKRRDHLTGLFVEMLAALLPWHPLLWWVRRRLTTLSEAVCDDWVVAGGHVGVDYAESLLNLSPQRQLAFLPTVVGKERAMKERIHRIVKDRCGNPRIGTAWTLAIVTLAALITAGTALAQRRPVERPRPEQREAQELRRDVLRQELAQLVDQVRDLEAALRQRGDEPGPEKQEIEFRLELKHQLIEAMERRLANLEPPRSRPSERDEMAAHKAELERKAEELVNRGAWIDRRLKELGDGHPEARERLEMELREVNENLERLEREKIEIDQQRDRPGRRGGLADVDALLKALSEHEDSTRERAASIERDLETLGDSDPGTREELLTGLRKVREDLEGIEKLKIKLQQERDQMRQREGRPEIEARMDELNRHQDELREHAGNLERKLEELGDRRPEERERIEMQLREIRQELERREREKIEIDQQPARRRYPQQEGRPDIEFRMQELSREQDELRGHARDIERKLEQLGDRRPEERAQLKRELLDVHEQLKVLEAEKARTERPGRERQERPRQATPEVRELAGRLRDLRQRDQELLEKLGHIEDKDSQSAQDLRAAINATREEMRDLDRKLAGVAASTRDERSERRRGTDEDPMRAREGLLAQIREVEAKLREAEETDRPAAAQRLRNVLEQLQARREAMDAPRAPEPETPRPPRENIQGQVEELRQKVDGMHEQMEEMRQMLQKLLERREEVRDEVEVEVHR